MEQSDLEKTKKWAKDQQKKRSKDSVEKLAEEHRKNVRSSNTAARRKAWGN